MKVNMEYCRTNGQDY